MVFGFWAIFTAVICLLGFSYMVYLSFGEESVEKPMDDGIQENSSES